MCPSLNLSPLPHLFPVKINEMVTHTEMLTRSPVMEETPSALASNCKVEVIPSTWF